MSFLPAAASISKRSRCLAFAIHLVHSAIAEAARPVHNAAAFDTAVGAIAKTIPVNAASTLMANARSDLWWSSAQISCMHEEPANAGKKVITAIHSAAAEGTGCSVVGT